MPQNRNGVPLADAVAKNQFRQQAHERMPMPPYSEAREKLPVPVLPGHEQFIEMYWRAWEMTWTLIRTPKAGSHLIANYIANPHTDSLFMWDSCFILQYALYARQATNLTTLLDNFYARQYDDGFICREIDIAAGSGRFYPFDPNGTGPNILAWAEWRLFRATGDEERLAAVFWPLVGLHRWFRAHRTWPDGLYWATGMSSGLNNQPRVPDSEFYHRHWSWVDATMQACLNSRLLEQMATALGEEPLRQELSQEHTALISQINERFWNHESNFYQDIDPLNNFSPVKSIAAYWGLLDKDLIPAKRLEAFVRQLRESWAFNLPHRIPSQSADSLGFNTSSGNLWRGAVWPATNYMVLKGLRTMGFYGLAQEIAQNHLQNIWQVYQKTDTFWQNYAPETAAPGDPAHAKAAGWTSVTPIAMLIEDFIGINIDWPQKRVTWDRLLPVAGLYGVCSLPLGTEGTIDLLGDQDKIFLTTDRPLTIVIRDQNQSLQAAVPIGTTEIELN